MFSQSFLGREIFAAVWGLSVLSAARRLGPALRFPFDVQLRSYADAEAKNLAAVWEAIARCTCLDADVMMFAVCDAPWIGDSLRYPDLDSLKMELVLPDPETGPVVDAKAFSEIVFDDLSVQRAYRHHLVRLLGALLAAHWVFCIKERDGGGREVLAISKRDVGEVFDRLAMLIDWPTSPGSLFAATLDEWRRTPVESSTREGPRGAYTTYLEDWKRLAPKLV